MNNSEARGEAPVGGFGRIVNVASTSVREPIAGLMLSNSHRAAMVTAFKTIALEVAAEGVTLNTPIERLGEPGLGEPEEFAAAAAFLCSARASYIAGETLAVDGGKTRSVF